MGTGGHARAAAIRAVAARVLAATALARTTPQTPEGLPLKERASKVKKKTLLRSRSNSMMSGRRLHVLDEFGGSDSSHVFTLRTRKGETTCGLPVCLRHGVALFGDITVQGKHLITITQYIT